MKSNARRYECFAMLRMKGSVSLSLCVKESWMFCGKRMSLLKPRSGLTPNTLNFTFCKTGNLFSGEWRRASRRERVKVRESVSERVYEQHYFALFECSLNSYPRLRARCSRVKRFSNTRAHQEENRVSRISHVIYYSTPLLVILNAQQGECANNEQTKKESTSEKSGEREDGFEGRERRTFGVVFEDS